MPPAWQIAASPRRLWAPRSPSYKAPQPTGPTSTSTRPWKVRAQHPTPPNHAPVTTRPTTKESKCLSLFAPARFSRAPSARHCCTRCGTRVRQTCRHHHVLHPRFRLKASICSSSKTSRHALTPSNKKSESRWHLRRQSRPYAVPLFWRKTSSHLIHSGGSI